MADQTAPTPVPQHAAEIKRLAENALSDAESAGHPLGSIPDAFDSKQELFAAIDAAQADLDRLADQIANDRPLRKAQQELIEARKRAEAAEERIHALAEGLELPIDYWLSMPPSSLRVIGAAIADQAKESTSRRDRAEAAEAQLAAERADADVTPAMLQPDDLAALQRLDELFSDGQGWNLPKTTMQRLTDIGVIRHHSRGVYGFTSFGRHVVDRDGFPLPLKTAHEFNEDAAIASRTGRTS